jgi:Zinc finger protein
LNNEQKKSLRNFPAYLDDLQAMGVDCHAVARQIALGLAVGHWEAQHDMTDVEFVIAGRYTPLPTESRAHTLPLQAYDQRDELGNRSILVGAPPVAQHGLPPGTQMWLVDFDKCNRVRVWDDTLAGDIRKLALGICANDPYYPNPLPDTQFGWDVFVTFTETYILAGRHLLQRAFDKVATSDAQLQRVLDRPAMVMREWTRIVMNAKRNNERGVFDERMRLRKENGWAKPKWAIET